MSIELGERYTDRLQDDESEFAVTVAPSHITRMHTYVYVYIRKKLFCAIHRRCELPS